MQFVLPVVITLTELLGTVMAASAQVVYGEVQWNPLQVVLLWDNRTAKFFAGFLFAFANVMTNVAGNSVPFANDLMGLFPKYAPPHHLTLPSTPLTNTRLANLRRGQIICAMLGFAICPWLIQAKAQRFLGFLNGYTVFLGSLIGVLLSDYWLVRRGAGYNVRALYSPGNKLYWYTGGFNWRAVVALLMGIVPLLPGLAHNINPDLRVGRGALNYYTMSWLVSLVVSAVTYYLLALARPWETDPGEVVEGREDVEAEGERSEVVTESGDEKAKGL